MDRTMSLPMIHVQSVTPTYAILGSPFLSRELQALMKEVEQLREETKEISCKCSNPDCPFNAEKEVEEERENIFYEFYEEEEEEEDSPDLGFGSMERLYRVQQINKKKNRQSLPPTSTPLRLLTPPETRRSLLVTARNSTSLTSIPRGIQKRADGTIVENDYPGFYSRDKRCYSKLTSGFSMTHLNRLKVISNEALESDCQVDQDGLTNNEDYLFTREAPERKIMRTPHMGRKKTSMEFPMNALSRHSSAGVILRQTSDPSKRPCHNSLASIDNPSDKLSNFLRSKHSKLARHSIIA